MDILLASKNKTDDSFSLTQFLIEGFTTQYILDRNGSDGGILVYIREDIPSKLILTDFSNRERYFLELNFILIGDFNAEESDTTIKDFCDIYSFKNLIKDATCFKNPDKPKCIDLMLTDRKRSFQNSQDCLISTK